VSRSRDVSDYFGLSKHIGDHAAILRSAFLSSFDDEEILAASGVVGHNKTRQTIYIAKEDQPNIIDRIGQKEFLETPHIFSVSLLPRHTTALHATLPADITQHYSTSSGERVTTCEDVEYYVCEKDAFTEYHVDAMSAAVLLLSDAIKIWVTLDLREPKTAILYADLVASLGNTASASDNPEPSLAVAFLYARFLREAKYKTEVQRKGQVIMTDPARYHMVMTLSATALQLAWNLIPESAECRTKELAEVKERIVCAQVAWKNFKGELRALFGTSLSLPQSRFVNKFESGVP